MERRLAVIDLGSNSFRLVVFTHTPEWWKRTDEIYEPVRVGEGQEEGGPLQAEPMERALETIELFAHFCRAMGIEHVRPLATSAIREASNRAEFVRAAKERAGLDVEVLSREEEARYGYLAAVNSTTLSDGLALDIGGGSMQLTLVRDRHAMQARSWRLGAVVTTENFLAADKVRPKHVKALRAHVHAELDRAPWLPGATAEMTGVGGAVRNLAAAAILREELPSYGVQGYLPAPRLPERADRRGRGHEPARAAPDPRHQARARRPDPRRGDGDRDRDGARRRRRHRGHPGRPARGRVLRHAAGRPGRPALPRRPRGQRPQPRRPVPPRPRPHRARRAASRSRSGTAWRGPGSTPATPTSASCCGPRRCSTTSGRAVDYDDHHKHSRYLILNAGLPGYSPREAALIGQAARYHRKGRPALREFAPLARKGDEALLVRVSTALRLAEQLERARDQTVRHVALTVGDGAVELALESDADVTVSAWAAARQAELFRLAFDRDLEVRATARTA